ncbi:MAG: hypothetical protein OXE86_05535 [Alphaproteobacteria bacterium]|nr:hypothetical protein [Alphaproteobacteria bacterium]
MRNPIPGPGRSRMRTSNGNTLSAGLVLLLAGIVLASGPGVLRAASGTGAHDRPAPGSLVSRLRTNGAELTRLPSAHGLEGWNVRLPGGSSYILYLTPDGAGVIGHLYDPDGRSVTARHLQALSGDPTAAGNAPLRRAPDHVVAVPAVPANPARPAPVTDGVQTVTRPAAEPAGAPGGVSHHAPAAIAASGVPAADGRAVRAAQHGPVGSEAGRHGAGAHGTAPAAVTSSHATGTQTHASRVTGTPSMTGTGSAGSAGRSVDAAGAARARPSVGASLGAAPLPAVTPTGVSTGVTPGSGPGSPGVPPTGPRRQGGAQTVSSPSPAPFPFSPPAARAAAASGGTGQQVADTVGEAALLRRTREAPGIELLPGSPVLHVIADPGCGPSRAWIDTLMRYRTAGFGLRVLPVGLMGAASARAALWILEQPDRAAAWHATAGRSIGEGDLAGTSADLLAGNNALFAAWQGRVLPLSVRAVPEGVERIDGVPADAAALVRRLVLEDLR